MLNLTQENMFEITKLFSKYYCLENIIMKSKFLTMQLS
jgi:hypothetical protein